MLKNKLNYRLVNILLLMAIIYIVVQTSGYWGGIILKVFNILVPFILAFAFAYILNPFVKKLEEKGVRRSLALVLVILIVFGLLIGILCITLPAIYEQLVAFSKTITQVINDFSGRFDLDLGEFETTVVDTLNELIKNLGSSLSTGTIDVLGKSVNILTNAMIVVIVGIYLLIDMDKIRKVIKKYLRPHKKQYNYVKTIDHEIGNYLHGLAIFMVVQLIEYSLLFKLVGHPSWLLLGLLACVTTVIPYFGGLFTNIIAVITASVVSTKLFIATLIITLIFPNIDGYVISPHIYGKTNNINPIFVIFVALVCSSIFGIWGMMIGLPLYLLIRTTWRFFHTDIKEAIEEYKEEKSKN